ncbi:MAG: hypothetical protein R2852_06115 [Bacteroidia bacterium]
MMKKLLKLILVIIPLFAYQSGQALSSSDVNVRMISGYLWMDNSCTAGGPEGKVVSFRIVNTKGSLLKDVELELDSVGFIAAGGTSYTSGTPSFLRKTSTKVFIGDIAAGDSATAFFFVGYNCLGYPNNTNLTTDSIVFPVIVNDDLSGIVSKTFKTNVYVIRNANNNTITVLATSTNTLGTITTISVAYSISNIKPTNIIDMELSTNANFPAGYEILGCKITASSATADFPVNLLNTHYSNSIISNLPSGGTVTIEWYLKSTQATTGITFANIVPFVVSDAGSAQRWQGNVTSFTGTSTPVNPLTITKRVNLPEVLVDDTVVYTIVIHNSSTTDDISIDKLVDFLPRDYHYKYLDTNVNAANIVNYENSRSLPPFEDTSYLYFRGQVQTSPGVFSWVVPMQDSIVLTYSVQVSSTIGFNDTNFVSAYIGNSVVGTAFAEVDVLSFLPLKVVYFDAQLKNNAVELKWGLSEAIKGSYFEVHRKYPNQAESESFTKVHVLKNNSLSNFACLDHQYQNDQSNSLDYELKLFTPSGQILSYFTEVNLEDIRDPYKVNYSYGMIHVLSSKAKNSEIEVSIFDALGRELESRTLYPVNGVYNFPLNQSFNGPQVLYIKIHSTSEIYTQKLLVQQK